MVSLVLVDLDGTMLTGTSAERRFLLNLLRHKFLGIRQIAAFLLFAFRWIHQYGKNVWKKDKAYLTGLRIEDIESLAATFVRNELVEHICPRMKERIDVHHRNGDTTVLLTGTLEFIARPVILYLGMHYVCATVCSTRNGKFTSAPPVKHPLGREKLQIGKNLCRKLGYKVSDCIAYGNSSYDIPLLEAVSRPVAVRPQHRLRRVALNRSWVILE